MCEILLGMSQGAAIFSPEGVTWTPISPSLARLRRSALSVVCAVVAVAVTAVAVLVSTA